MNGLIRIGLIGAGANTRRKHIPGFRALDGVRIVGVANRTLESGEAVAAEFDIPRVYPNWRALIESDDVDAVCIGTWPYMHCPVTLAALERGKHVLCEARMASNAEEARLMLQTARENGCLVTQVVPAPHTLPFDAALREIVDSGRLGDLLAVDLNVSAGFLDRDAPFLWRHSEEFSGFNTLSLGIHYEAMMRWIGPATRVMAMTRVCVPRRKDAEGVVHSITVPDHVDVLADMACGARARMRFSAVCGLAGPNEFRLYGSEGTLRFDMTAGRIEIGARGDETLAEHPVPEYQRGVWRVEEEFIHAMRGVEKVKLTRFEDGVRYMEFTEAVRRSAQFGEPVPVPL